MREIIIFWAAVLGLILVFSLLKPKRHGKVDPPPKKEIPQPRSQEMPESRDVTNELLDGVLQAVHQTLQSATLQQEIKLAIAKCGVQIYAWERECYKCHKKTKIYSYYLIHDLEKYFAGDLGLEQCGEIGLGYIPSLDAFVAEQLPDAGIKLRYSRSEEMRYFANCCSHCDCLQGRNYIVDDPDEIFEDLYMGGDMEQYRVTTLFVSGSVADDIADYIVTSLGI